MGNKKPRLHLVAATGHARDVINPFLLGEEREEGEGECRCGEQGIFSFPYPVIISSSTSPSPPPPPTLQMKIFVAGGPASKQRSQRSWRKPRTVQLKRNNFLTISGCEMA